MEADSQLNREKRYIKGRLLYTIFHNEQEHFSIAKIKIEDTNENYEEKEIVAKGYFANLNEHTSYYFYGEMERHVKFGLQYKVTSYQTALPDTKDGIIAYLSSDLFYGIGKKTAEKIVHRLGESAISKILKTPEVLDDIPGLKKDTAKRLYESLLANQGFEQIMIYLSKYGIGLKMAQKIFEAYREDAIHKLEEDPYQFVFDIEGFGFQTADMIAEKNGLPPDHPNRISAGCMYVLQQSMQDGHVYLPATILIQKVSELLSSHAGITESAIADRLDALNTDKKLIVQNGRVYLPSLYYAEDGFAAHLHRVMQHPIEEEVPVSEIMKYTGEIEEKEALSYGKDQFHAIEQALHSKLMILTGGPGTGKTTVVKAILTVYAKIHGLSLDPADYQKKSEYPFVLTAPTGRAAKRLSESTGLPARTIHRLLGWNGANGFDKDEKEPLEGKFLIVDEFSMVDIWLAHQLFKAIPNDMQVLLVGDEDQLPSVGPGQVLSDLLNSEKIPQVTLNEVYRQKEGSKIIQLAHQIKNDQLADQDLTKDQDFSFIPCYEHQVLDAITQVFDHAKEKGIDLKNIQVLAPMYRSKAGITAINKQLQQLINPKTEKKREVTVGDAVFRVGDRVIQLVNQPEDGVYNGDIGEIVAIFKAEENKEKTEQLVIQFVDKEIAYERSDYTNFMHAYCISIHKSQGSEFPIVILPVVSVYRRMLRKNLLYTAITRSKQSLIIIGERDAFLKGVKTEDTNNRYTTLKEQLQLRISEQADFKDNIEAEEDDELSPYDFM